MSQGFKGRTLLKFEHNAGKGKVKFLESDLPGTRCRVVQIHSVRPKPSTTTKWLKFQNTIAGQRMAKIRRFLLVAFGLKAVIARGLQNVAGFAAVAGDPAIDPQFLERNIARSNPG